MSDVRGGDNGAGPPRQPRWRPADEAPQWHPVEERATPRWTPASPDQAAASPEVAAPAWTPVDEAEAPVWTPVPAEPTRAAHDPGLGQADAPAWTPVGDDVAVARWDASPPPRQGEPAEAAATAETPPASPRRPSFFDPEPEPKELAARAKAARKPWYALPGVRVAAVAVVIGLAVLVWVVLHTGNAPAPDQTPANSMGPAAAASQLAVATAPVQEANRAV